MPSHRPPSRLVQAVLVVFVAAAVVGFGTSFRTPAWFLLLPAAISPFWRVRSVPRVLREGARFVAGAFLLLALVLGFQYMAFPAIPAETAARLSVAAGYGLAFFSVVFLLGTAVWNPAATLFPAMLGTLVVACFNTVPHLYGTLAVSGTSACAYLLTDRSTQGSRTPAVRRGILGPALSLTGVFLVAAMVIQFLPWAQERVERATFGLLSPQADHYSALSLESRLGDLQELKRSSKVVMRVWSTRPQKLRGRVFSVFDGRSWHSRGPAVASLAPLPEEITLDQDVQEWLEAIPGNTFLARGIAARDAASAGTIRTKIVQNVFNSGLMVSPGQRLLLRAPLESMREDAHETLAFPLSSPVQIYAVINRRDGEVVQAASPSPELFRETLAIPQDTDPRFRELAARIETEAATPEARLEHTVNLVQHACQYSLEVGRFRSRQPVAEFFFEKKQGYCQYFASAAAILLRLQGIPCRYVTGFNPQEWNYRGGHLVVRERDAHAWLEAYLPGKGWVTADPTPDAELDAAREGLGEGWWAAAEEWVKAEWAEISIRMREGDWRGAGRWLLGLIKRVVREVAAVRLGGGALVAAVAALLGVIVWSVMRRRQQRVRGQHARLEPTHVAPELAAMMRQVENLFTRRGYRRPPSRAPLEHVRAIPEEKISPRLRDASVAIIECYYRALFGGELAEPSRLHGLQRALDDASEQA